jgi:hypothetical protein
MKKAQIVALVFCAVFLALVLSCASSGGGSFNTIESSALNWEWVPNDDHENGGSSTNAMTKVTQEGMPAYAFKGAITNKYQYGFATVQVTPTDADTLEKLKACTGLSFRILGNGERYAVKIPTSDVKDYAYFEYVFDTVKGIPITVVVPTKFLMQPSWGRSIGGLKMNNATFIEFQTTRNGSPGPFEFTLWDLKLHNGGVPSLTPEQKAANDQAKKDAAAADAKAPPKTVGGNLGAQEIILQDNFEYGDGYQAVFSDTRLFNGLRIGKGEKYTLKITYSASRDLEDDVMVGLVDTSPAASYWKPLSWSGDGMAMIKKTKAGEVVSTTLNFTTLDQATSASAPANALVFVTKGAGKKGTKGSGVQKPVTFKVTEFVFTKN